MERIEDMTIKMLYRGILKGAKTYPSKNKSQFC
jgi:hypothetical protein